ncbi:MAG: sigma-54-dependent Fis family transcriptional regulator [Fibrobacteres bacterium]|nr:sigma-54-dependent Fis family transcriptional regulator [Fibrobacterota bacterium]
MIIIYYMLVHMYYIDGFQSFYPLCTLSVGTDGTSTLRSSTPYLPHYSADQIDVFKSFLLQTSFIHELFAIPVEHSKDGLKGVELDKLYPLNQKYQRALYSLNIYSTLPTHFCLFSRANGELNANILHKPVLEGSENSPIFYFDESENITAFNIPFIDLFKNSSLDKDALFTKNLNTLFVNTPQQLLQQRLQKEPGNELSSKEINLLAGGELKDLKEVNIISGQREIYPGKYKTTLRLRYKSGQKQAPIFMFGAPEISPITGYTPDYSGFSIGPNGDASHILLKKSGWYLLSSRINNIDSGEHLIELTLYRKSIEFVLDGTVLFRCDLFETYWPESFYFHLYIRQSDKIEISEFTLCERAISFDAKETPVFLQLRHMPERFFSLEYIPRMFLSERSLGIMGIALHEVTILQKEIINNRERITSLKKDREEKKKENQFVGNSPPVVKMLSQVMPLSKSEITILLEGATGSGKEVLARYIHSNSTRFDKTFVKMDCSTIPDSLFESIVFGHVKGAFTGAANNTTGIIESANQGTLFIDEIQNLSLSAQAKLLRILEERVVQKTGSNEVIPVDIRFIAGTNQNLERRIKEGTFREDLYYRINLAVVLIPELNDRKEDIPDLCYHFISQYNSEMATRVENLSYECITLLKQYSWPGNVRELKNVVYHACIFAVNNKITPEVIHQLIDAKNNAVYSNVKGESKRFNAAGKKYRDALDKRKGNAVLTAKDLGISRNTLYYNMKKYGINPSEFRG